MQRGTDRHTDTHTLMAVTTIYFASSTTHAKCNKNSSGDEIANVSFYAVHPEPTRIRWNNAK